MLEEIEYHLSDAKYTIFDVTYKKMLQRTPRFEQSEFKFTRQEQIEL